jgi:hypothetical protein
MSDTYTPFQPLKYDQQEVSRQGWGIANSGPNDNQLMVGFYKRSVLNRFKSSQQGTPVHEGRDFIKIQHPGESLNVVDREVTDQDKHRWPQKWEAYIKNVAQVPDGIPLSLLYPSKPEIVETLRGYNIQTVQQLAALSGHAISTVGMGCQEWVNAAAAYMKQADKGVDHHKFNAAMNAKDQQIATLNRQVEELTRLVQQKLAQPNEPRPRNANMANPMPPQHQDFDYQTEMLNASHASADDTQAFLQPPAQFVQDLSGSVEPPKRRGRPPGSTNKPKE